MPSKLACASVLFSLLLTTTVFAQTRVEFELVTDPGFPLGGERQWLSMLGEIPGTTVRIRAGRGRERPEVTKVGERRYRVVGILTSRNQLELPGGRFGLSDRERITGWMTRLGDEGATGLTAPRGIFGLTEEQLVDLHERMTAPVRFSTQSLPTDEFTMRLQRQVAVEISWKDTSPVRAPVLDEFEGFSAGTSLALALRPHGLAVVPQRAGGRTRLDIVRARKGGEYWPAGWPAERPPKDTVPDLFKFLNVEIHDTPVAETLDAIQQRVNVPFFYDHNALAQHNIDLKTTKASIPSGRTFYKNILDKVLFKAMLRCEIRTDEAGKSFLWITR